MQPFPKFIGALAVVIAALAGVGHDTLATLFGAWAATAIPAASAVIAALSHSLTGTGGK
jgi:hypothetical protein